MASPIDAVAALEAVIHRLRRERWLSHVVAGGVILATSVPLLSVVTRDAPPWVLAVFAVLLAAPLGIAAWITARAQQTFVAWAAAYLGLAGVLVWQSRIELAGKFLLVIGYTLFTLWRTQRLVNALRLRQRLTAPSAPAPDR